MGPLDLFFHLLNFVAPAAFLAVTVALGARFLMKKRPKTLSWWASAAINFVACLTVSALGLWLGGQDGRVLTYAALVFVCASSQWLVIRGWRA